MSSVKGIQKEISNETVAIYLSWEIDESNLEELKNIMNPILDSDFKHLILNIKDLTYINSSVIWWFVWEETNFINNWKKFVFSECNEDIYEILELVWLIYAVDTYDNNEEALLSLEQ